MTDLQLLVRSINIRLQNLYTTFCCKVNTCLGISPTGDASLVLNQQGEWINNGGGGSYYLYSENYDAGSFIPQSATGSNSIAMGGSNAQANGDFSIAWGQESVSNGVLSMAFGENCSSFGETSISLGKSCLSNGNASISMGYGAISKSYSETALGTQNTDYTPISPTSFQLTDRLLVVGNGDLTQSDALTILKNGKTGIDIDNFEQTTSLAKLQVNGLISANIQTINVTNLDLTENNITQTILVDNSISGVNITLPDPTISYYNGMSIRLTIKLITNNIINTINVLPYGSQKIDNQDSFTFTKAYQSIDLVTDGTNWWIVSNNN